ncbi:coproporphyrinogen III oxidase-like Fe-S oxidoreductase [Bradyrhizobium sp. LB8.2]
MEIDPRTLTEPMAEALGFSGVNRASLGVQSFDPEVQRAINRLQSFEQTARCVELLRRAGVSKLNFDLLYGLPLQTVDSCLDTVAKCIELRPDRFSVFGYAHIPSFKKHQRKINENALPDSVERHLQSETIAQALMDAGYVRIGFDHFALPHDNLAAAKRDGRLRRNFQGYTDDTAETLIGLGASAIGRMPDGLVQNAVPTRDYLTRIAEDRLASVKGYAFTGDDRFRADLIERVMCDMAVDLSRIARSHNQDPKTAVIDRARLLSLIADGAVTMKDRPDHGPRRRRIPGTERRFRVRCPPGAIDCHAQPSGLNKSTGSRVLAICASSRGVGISIGLGRLLRRDLRLRSPPSAGARADLGSSRTPAAIAALADLHECSSSRPSTSEAIMGSHDATACRYIAGGAAGRRLMLPTMDRSPVADPVSSVQYRPAARSEPGENLGRPIVAVADLNRTVLARPLSWA